MKEERRRFFRINDTVGVAYRILTEEEVEANGKTEKQPTNMFSLLANYETELNNQLADLKTKQPAVEKVLALMNKKLNCLINHFEMETSVVERLVHEFRDVNISACGIAFVAEGELPIDQDVSLDIVLQPEERHIFTYGKVIGSDAHEDGAYVRINFYGMSDLDQEFLIQHIVQRQGSQLRTQLFN